MKKKPCNKYLSAILAVILAVLFSAIGGSAGMLLTTPLKSCGEAAAFLSFYLSFIGIWIVTILFCLKSKTYKNYLPKLFKGGVGNNLKTALIIGLPLGIGLNLLEAVIAMLHGDFTLSFSSFNPLMLVIFMAAILIQSGAEELCGRFFIYQRLNDLFPGKPVIPILVNSLFFAGCHIVNPGVTVRALLNILLVGILYSLVIYYFDSFWAVCIAHMSWNFCQNILLGLPNSGIVSVYSLFKLDASTAVDSFAYSANFGIEGSVLSCAFLAIACVVIILIGRKRNNR